MGHFAEHDLLVSQRQKGACAPNGPSPALASRASTPGPTEMRGARSGEAHRCPRGLVSTLARQFLCGLASFLSFLLPAPDANGPGSQPGPTLQRSMSHFQTRSETRARPCPASSSLLFYAGCGLRPIRCCCGGRCTTSSPDFNVEFFSRVLLAASLDGLSGRLC